MRLLLYCQAKEQLCIRLKTAIEDSIGSDQMELVERMSQLHKILRRPSHRPQVMVVAVSTAEQLEALLGLDEFLEQTRIILVSPEVEQGAKLLQRKLRCTYSTNFESDFGDVQAVLSKILSLTNQTNDLIEVNPLRPVKVNVYQQP